MNEAELKSEIEALVRRNIASGEVINVVVRRVDDGEEDRFIDVKVVFDNKSGGLDPKDVVGISTKARRALLEKNEMYFPVFYFISKDEAGQLVAAE